MNKEPSLLELKNTHERDSHISFEAGPHLYTIHGDKSKKYTSVTTWNHQHFSHFDADGIIRNMMKSKNWPNSPYYGKTPQEIKAGWELNRDEAASAGTKLHYDIECYYNGMASSENTSIEYQYFLDFAKASDLKPYRTEWMIYHEELLLAGSIDMVFEIPEGGLMIYDWKRAKEIKKTDSFMKFALTPCISHLPDTNYWHYALQLNTYKAIIEEKYQKKITALRLVCLHPNNKSYIVLSVPDLQKEIKELFQERINVLMKST
jgi:hypothetical protein